MNATNSRCEHPILCITPPHMLREIAERGTTEQRAKAVRTLAVSGQFRGQRQALTGVVMPTLTKAIGGKERVVYDARHSTTLPGTRVRGESDPPVADVAVNEAFDGAGATYDLYHDCYGRNSVDGNGLRLDSTVHYDNNYDNAFWNGEQMVYGDGDGQLFNRFTISIDVIGHELTHGVTQYDARLLYQDQPGALNESMSDVFGSLVKQQVRGQTADQADWIIGEGLLAPGVKGVGLRSMKAPGTAYDDPVLGKDPQPANMSGYVNATYDNGGVHINSGIPNHAFYVTAVEIGGHAWEKAGAIWYNALHGRLQPASNFQAAAQATVDAAAELFGANSLEQKAVIKGWSEVGVSISGGTTPGTTSGCLVAPLAFVMALTRAISRKS